MHYAWGSVDLLPALMGLRPDGRPVAEVWMGAHPAAPSSIEVGGRRVALDSFIAENTEQALGLEAMTEHGSHLSFMMKLLAAEKPLSLQVHPTRQQAEEGYRREATAGISPTDPTRNYRDSSHKPEMLYALTPFEMMCGFRPVEAIRELLEGLRVESLEPILACLERSHPEVALRSAFETLLHADPDHRRSVTDAVVTSAHARRGQRPEYLFVVELTEEHPDDVGVVASLFLNHVRIQAGEAVFIAAGVLHSYVRGLGVELMATSDNVLRAGLTPKHVAVQEVLRSVSYVAGVPQPLVPEVVGDVSVYLPPVSDFSLWVYTPRAAGDDATRTAAAGPPKGARIIVSCGERTVLSRRAQQLVLEPGQAAFIPDADGPFDILTNGAVAVACHRP